MFRRYLALLLAAFVALAVHAYGRWCWERGRRSQEAVQQIVMGALEEYGPALLEWKEKT